MKYFILLILALLLSSCIFNRVIYNRVPRDNNGEHILNKKVKYRFVKIPNKEDLIKIDTAAYYVQIFEGRYYNNDEKNNPQIWIFHSDGYFKKTYSQYYLKYDSNNKNSTRYGGKYRIIESVIELEQFFPITGAKTNYYTRNITKGKIDGDKIIFDDGNSLITILEKKYKL
ncbi:hypothetical protein [Psychroserpens jangbogonensis]|uniref:hypothetical protein n=1 Tax=Psychroserpens jangbogonensis TaxID=1484460 RepID=UPI00053E536A|nr:hypothetical protein [Psychroserpens jangbogonensis]